MKAALSLCYSNLKPKYLFRTSIMKTVANMVEMISEELTAVYGGNAPQNEQGHLSGSTNDPIQEWEKILKWW